LFQGPKEIRARNWEVFADARTLDYVILTHAHIDHSGYIPKLIREGFRGRIITTAPTKALCEILLPDSGRLHEEDARFANITKHSHHDPALPLYTEADAIAALRYFDARPCDEWIELSPGCSVRFLRAGHILGSSILQLALNADQKQHIVTFSGDLGNGRSLILKDPSLIVETDTLVMESTYGDRMQPKDDPSEAFANVIEKVLGRGGTLVIPAFALGRTQEIIYILHCLEEAGRIPKYPVYLDSPMAGSVTEVYSKLNGDIKLEHNPGKGFDFSTANFKIVGNPDDSMLLCMDNSPKIVISAAGMLTGGRVLHHLKAQLPRPESGVLFVGYQAEGTKGLLLKNGLRNLRIHHNEIMVEAEIFSIENLSAHADSNDLVSWVNAIQSKPSATYLVHGESNALRTLQYRLIHECKLEQVYIPRLGESFRIPLQT
jgi:metallo-beta-lactamase family protein